MPLIALLLGCGSPERTVGDLGDQPFLQPIDAPRTVALVDGGEVDTRASTCGGCHPEHHAEWQASTHAASLRDLQFLGELAKPGQPRWLCLDCHLPTRPQRADRIRSDTALRDGIRDVAREPEPDFDPERVGEGLSCATCHVRRDPDGRGTIVGPRGSGRAPHRVRHDPDALRGVCAQCHGPGPIRLTAELVCWFETPEEIAAGPQAGTGCPTCHMPTTTRPAASGGPAVALRRHLWIGGGVPKSYDGYLHLRESGFEPGLDVEVARDPLRVRLTNARAAHALPTADPERHLRVEVRSEDATGAVLGRDLLRIGQRWDWGDDETGRPARRIADDRLRPGASREWTPRVQPGADHVVVEVAHVRLSPDNARWLAGAVLDAELAPHLPPGPSPYPAIDQHYPLGTVIFRATVPLDGRPVEEVPLDALLAESAALSAAPLAEKAERFAVP